MRNIKSLILILFLMTGTLTMSCNNKEDMSKSNLNNQTVNQVKSDSLAPCITDCLMSLPYQDVSTEEEKHLVLMRE